MRIMYASLPMAAASLLLGWAATSPAGTQSCCHGSAAKTAHFGTTRAIGMPAMPLVTTVAVRREFNASSGKVRIVALLSPTCPGCQSGHAVVGQILKRFSSPEVQAILVWEPMRMMTALSPRPNRPRAFATLASGRAGTGTGVLAMCSGRRWNCMQPPGMCT